jgi:hypothetical protein
MSPTLLHLNGGEFWTTGSEVIFFAIRGNSCGEGVQCASRNSEAQQNTTQHATSTPARDIARYGTLSKQEGKFSFCRSLVYVLFITVLNSSFHIEPYLIADKISVVLFAGTAAAE